MTDNRQPATVTMSIDRKIVITNDGSSTVLNTSLNQHYHSIHGAMQESLHVFMKMGWSSASLGLTAHDKTAILEVGFGTGLNAFLVLREILQMKNRTVIYTSLETFPLKKEELSGLNYAHDDAEKELFQKLHDAEWNKKVPLNKNFILHKIQAKLEDFIPQENSFDLIFFDAFSPEAQPELWTEEIFRKLFSAMKENGILVTYCAKGQVRRNMKAAGFTVERLQGPPGKREMLRAQRQ